MTSGLSDTDVSVESGRGRARSIARLAVVQALYQIELSRDSSPQSVIEEFKAHRFGSRVDEVELTHADIPFFEEIVAGVASRREEIDAHITGALAEGWRLGRLETIMGCILRGGVLELMARPDVPTAVVINEYIDIAHGFYVDTEPAFVNGILDTLAKKLRD